MIDCKATVSTGTLDRMRERERVCVVEGEGERETHLTHFLQICQLFLKLGPTQIINCVALETITPYQQTHCHTNSLF